MKLQTPISALRGIGKIQGTRLKMLGIFTLGDLLRHFPTRYEDYRPELEINKLRAGDIGTITGTIIQVDSRKTRGGRLLIEALIDQSGIRLNLAWFGNKFVVQQLLPGIKYRFSGKVAADYPRGAVFLNPVFEPADRPPVQTARLLPVYPLVAGITERMMRRYIMDGLKVAEIEEIFPTEISRRFAPRNDMPDDGLGRAEAFRMIHDPKDHEEPERARQRFAFEELYLMQLASAVRKRERASATAPEIKFQQEGVQQFVQSLKFTLTNAQKKAAWRILQDLEKPSPMHRLLNGDVGSGKTAVAAVAAFNITSDGYQVALLAPTEILARQHFATFKQMFATAPKVQIGLVTSGARVIASHGIEETIKPKEFESMLRENLVNCVIGTHALLEDWVKMPALALVIVDEQHRFGVKQREELTRKRGDKPPHLLTPHFLSMTATPIPRSLALVAYGDVDISVLDELPPGRVPVATKVLDRPVAIKLLQEKLRAGERGYVVCPLIDPSDILGVKSVEEVFIEFRKKFPGIVFSGLHGRMSSEEKQEVMEQLKNGQVQCVISTTVVEVGVDVPDATFICIEAAERFGLAELHQLRGRVGRGEKPGTCYLIPSSLKEAGIRLSILEKETSGFRIAEYDLRFRGHGELLGTNQSGIPEFRLARFDDVKMLEAAKEAVLQTMSLGPLNPTLAEELNTRFSIQAA